MMADAFMLHSCSASAAAGGTSAERGAGGRTGARTRYAYGLSL